MTTVRWLVPAMRASAAVVLAAALAMPSGPRSQEEEDTTPPQLQVSAAPMCLWPPNHKMALFRLGQEITYTVTDDGDPAPVVRITGVTSDEDELARGSGHTAPDFRFRDDATCLRSERAGPGDGRVYTVTLEATDLAGNVGTALVQIVVPHDMGHGARCEGSARDAVRAARCDPLCSSDAPRCDEPQQCSCDGSACCASSCEGEASCDCSCESESCCACSGVDCCCDGEDAEVGSLSSGMSAGSGGCGTVQSGGGAAVAWLCFLLAARRRRAA